MWEDFHEVFLARNSTVFQSELWTDEYVIKTVLDEIVRGVAARDGFELKMIIDESVNGSRFSRSDKYRKEAFEK